MAFLSRPADEVTQFFKRRKNADLPQPFFLHLAGHDLCVSLVSPGAKNFWVKRLASARAWSITLSAILRALITSKRNDADEWKRENSVKKEEEGNTGACRCAKSWQNIHFLAWKRENLQDVLAMCVYIYIGTIVLFRSLHGDYYP